MKIYTKTGDQGTTGLFGPDRVSKSDPRVIAIGSTDRFNASLGILISHVKSATSNQIPNQKRLIEFLEAIQSKLFDAGAALADTRTKPSVADFSPDLQALETQIDHWTGQLPEQKEFILPGGFLPASIAFWVRAVCRDAERDCVGLLNWMENQAETPTQDASHIKNVQQTIQLLNRLSDTLFVLGRWLNHQCGGKEPKWRKDAVLPFVESS